MKKDYILSHNWGSYETNETINKIMLRDFGDLKEYIKLILPQVFIAISIGNNIYKYDENTYFQILCENCMKNG